MAGPAIKHDELFDFPSYLKSIDEAKASTIELANILNKIAANTKSTLVDTLSQVSGKKMEFVNEKEISKLQAVDKELTNLGYSAEQSRTIMVGLAKVNTMTSDSIEAMKSKAKELQKVYESLSEEERNNAEVGGVLLKQFAELKNATNSYKENVKITTKVLTEAEGSYSALSTELARMKAELRAMPNAFDATTGAVNKENKAAVELSQKIAQADGVIKKMDGTMGNFFRNVGNYEGATVSLREQLKQMTVALAQMELEGKRGSEAYNQLLQKAGELKDAMNDTSSAIRRVGSDTNTIEGVASVFTGIAGAAAVAEGATALFGESNETVAETIKKLQAIQAMLMGVQAVANMLQKESAAILLVVNFQRKLEILHTNLQTAAESKNIVVRYTAIAAQKLLNAVMASNPVGLLLTAVIALAGAILYLTTRSRDAAKELETLNRIQNSLYESTYKTIELLKISGEENLSAAEDRIKESKAEGAGQLELMNLEIEAAEIRRKNASEIQSQFSRTKDDIDILTRQYERQREELEQLELTTTSGNKKGNELLEQKRKAADITFARIKAVMAANNEFAEADLDLDLKKIERDKLINEISLRNQKAAIESKLAKSREESQNEFNLKIQMMEVEKARTLTNTNLTEQERLAIVDKYARQELDLRSEFDIKQKENAVNAQIALINGQLALAVKGSDEEFRLKEELATKEYELAKIPIEASIKDEALKTAKLKELYDQQLAAKRELEKEKRLAELERINDKSAGGERLEIIKNQEIIASTRSTYQDINAARIANEQLAQQAIDREFALNQQKYNELLITHDEYEKRITELTIEQENLRLQRIQEAAEREKQIKQAVIDLIQGSVSAANTIFSDQVNARIEVINEEKDASIKAAGDNANAKARIDQEFNKRIGREKRRIAIADKAAALITAGINMALAISKVIPNVVLMALAAALGAVQVATIAAKPIPQFRRGTKYAPEGPAIINDEPGPTFKEIIMRDNIAYLPQERNQIVYLKKGDKVISAPEAAKKSLELNKILQEQTLQDSLSVKLESGRKLEVMHNLAGALQASKIDEKYIVDGIGKHIANLPIEQNFWDDNGYQRRTRKNNTVITNLNKRNSLC